MEIFQTIWTVLTTENQELVNIICAPLTFIESYVSMLIFTTILDIKATRNQKILYNLLFPIIALVFIFLVPAPYNTFLNIFTCPILVILIFKTNLLKAILAEIIPYAAFLLTSGILINIYKTIFDLPSVIITIPIYKITCSSFSYLLVYIIYRICKHFKINISLLDKMKKSNNLVLVLNFIIGIISIAILSYILTIYNDSISMLATVLSILTLLIYFTFSLYSLIRTNKLELTTQNLEEEKLYNKTLTILYDNIRGFKHDFNNIVQAIGGYITTEDIIGLKKYYSELLEDCQKINNLSILNPELINNPAIYSLLTSKYHTADELGIRINLEIFLDLNTINMKIYELTRILGILLDNAIEASNKCSEKTINIIIRNDKKQNRQLIIIENTYLDNLIDTEKIFEKGYTTKQSDTKSHGLGLWEVRQVLKKNYNLNLFTSKDDKLFKQQLEIYL